MPIDVNELKQDLKRARTAFRKLETNLSKNFPEIYLLIKDEMQLIKNFLEKWLEKANKT